MGLLIEKIFGEMASLILEGSIDTATSSQFKDALDDVMSDSKSVTLDFNKVKYISSAGLRVLLMAKKLHKDKPILIKGARAEVKEVFDITGFSSLFVFE